MEFNSIMKEVYEEYIKNGYKDNWENHKIALLIMNKDTKMIDLAEVGLFNTEVSEALESIRENDYFNLSIELADIIIRVMNFASRLNIPLERFILEKHEKNLKREKLHGKNI